MSDDFQSTPPAPTTPPVAPAGPATGGDAPDSTGKLLATLSYLFFLWPIPGIIALVIEPQKNDKWVRTHAIQSLALGLVIQVLTWVLSFILIGFVIYVAGVIYGIVLALKANKGESFEIPLVTNLVKQYI
ncbi:MAG: DUF4870 domain-containing protein [Coriobacteriia bacterium]|nr:DUF4870 domain-containing protein [Coriobacteriia bacterium]